MDTGTAKHTLEDEKARLERQMSEIGRPNPAVPGEWEPLPADGTFEPDILDQAEIATNREDNAAILTDLGARLVRVNDALERIESGTYGACEVCSALIEPARLGADPAATTCTKHL